MKLQENIKPGFITPDHFFETFEKNIILKIAEEKPVVRLNFWKKNKNWVFSSAAVLFISFVLVFQYYYSNPVINSETIAYEDILHLTDWDNELTENEISELKSEILIDENTIDEELLNLDLSELN